MKVRHPTRIVKRPPHAFCVDPPAMFSQLVNSLELDALDEHFRGQHIVAPTQGHVADLKPRLAQ